MGKGPPTKGKRRAPSIHSRAARRATSPSIDTDKSLKNVQPPAESVDYRPSVLSIHQGAGVTKKAKKGRNLSTKARKRQEKDQDRAAAVMERTENKVAKSKGQARTIQTRRKAWEEVNKHIPANEKESTMPLDEETSQDGLELDEEMDEAESGKPETRAVTADGATPGQAAMDEDDDGIL